MSFVGDIREGKGCSSAFVGWFVGDEERECRSEMLGCL